MQSIREVDQTIGEAESLVLRAISAITGVPFVCLWDANLAEPSPLPSNWSVEIETKE